MNVRDLFHPPIVLRIKTSAARFPAKIFPNMETALFDGLIRIVGKRVTSRRISIDFQKLLWSKSEVCVWVCYAFSWSPWLFLCDRLLFKKLSSLKTKEGVSVWLLISQSWVKNRREGELDPSQRKSQLPDTVRDWKFNSYCQNVVIVTE